MTLTIFKWIQLPFLLPPSQVTTANNVIQAAVIAQEEGAHEKHHAHELQVEPPPATWNPLLLEKQAMVGRNTESSCLYQQQHRQGC
jgi:hypothetical protein